MASSDSPQISSSFALIFASKISISFRFDSTSPRSIKDSHHLACGSAIYLMRLPRLVARDAADSGIFIEVAVEGKGMRDAKPLYDGEACAVNKAQ